MGDYNLCDEAKDKAACEAQVAADEAANKKKSDAMINALIGAGKPEAPPASAPDKPSKQITDSKPPDAPKEDKPNPQITESKPPPAPATTKTPWKPGDQIVPPKVPQWVDDEAPNADAKNDALHAAYKKDFKRWEQQQKAQAEWDKANPQAKNAVADTPTKDTKAVTNTQAAEAVKSAEAVSGDDAATKVEGNAAAKEAVKSADATATDATKPQKNTAAEEAAKSAKATADVAGQGSPPPPPVLPPEKFFPNPADLLEKSVAIDIFSVPTGAGVSFGAFVTSFTDSYTCNWNSVNASGRMDPIQTYQNTQRVISIEWDVIAGSIREAAINFEKCQRLVQMMYPTWAEGGKSSIASSVNSPPYFKFKFANLAASKPGPSGASNGEAAKSSGLFGTVGGVDVAPDFEVGVYVSGGNIYPKLISLSLEITVLHDHLLGHPKGKPTPSFSSFPYAVTGMAQGGEAEQFGEDETAPHSPLEGTTEEHEARTTADPDNPPLTDQQSKVEKVELKQTLAQGQSKVGGS